MAKSLSAPFIECSASDGVNIDVAFRELVKLVRKDERVCPISQFFCLTADRLAKIIRSQTKRDRASFLNLIHPTNAHTLQFPYEAIRTRPTSWKR